MLGNKFSEQDAARGESLRGAGGRAGHYLCGEVDPAPATLAVLGCVYHGKTDTRLVEYLE